MRFEPIGYFGLYRTARSNGGVVRKGEKLGTNRNFGTFAKVGTSIYVCRHFRLSQGRVFIPQLQILMAPSYSLCLCFRESKLLLPPLREGLWDSARVVRPRLFRLKSAQRRLSLSSSVTHSIGMAHWLERRRGNRVVATGSTQMLAKSQRERKANY